MSEPIGDVFQEVGRTRKKAEKEVKRVGRKIDKEVFQPVKEAIIPEIPEEEKVEKAVEKIKKEVPTKAKEGLKAAERETKRLRKWRRGRASTILAGREKGGSGVKGLGTRMLLGS